MSLILEKKKWRREATYWSYIQAFLGQKKGVKEITEEVTTDTDMNNWITWIIPSHKSGSSRIQLQALQSNSNFVNTINTKNYKDQEFIIGAIEDLSYVMMNKLVTLFFSTSLGIQHNFF